MTERETQPVEVMIEHRGARQRRSSRQTRMGLNLTAMIDIVFLLLIYFLVATKFKLGEEIYRMDLPERQPAQAQRDPFQLDREPLRVEVTSIGLRPDDYAVRLEGPYPQPATFDDLADFLARKQINESSIGGLFEADHPIVIVASGSTRWEHALGGFNAAARARYTNIMFARPR